MQAKRRLFEGSPGSMAPLSSIAGAEKVCVQMLQKYHPFISQPVFDSNVGSTEQI